MNEPSYFRYSISEMAQHAGVSERTFYAVCLERFGVGPKQLIIFRQMNDIRQALQQATPGEKVSQIASRHGIWEW